VDDIEQELRGKLFELASVEEYAAGALSRCLRRIAIECAAQADDW
jgi:hypothetical protein